MAELEAGAAEGTKELLPVSVLLPILLRAECLMRLLQN
jgi:hypothetical protein